MVSHSRQVGGPPIKVAGVHFRICYQGEVLNTGTGLHCNSEVLIQCQRESDSQIAVGVPQGVRQCTRGRTRHFKILYI